MKKFDAKAVEQLMTRLDELPERRTLRPYELIVQLERQLSKVQGRGYDLDDLMEVLREFGLELARSTVRNYLSRVRATQRKQAAPSAVTHLHGPVVSRPHDVSAISRSPTSGVPPQFDQPSSTPHALPSHPSSATPTNKPPDISDAPAALSASAAGPAAPHEATPSNDTTAPPRGHFKPKPDSREI